MKTQTKRMRIRAVAIGALLGSIVSLGVVADSASAASQKSVKSVIAVDDSMTKSSGVRW